MKRIAISIFLFLIIGGTAFGQTENRIEKKYDATVINTVKINNSFGDIKITPYDGKTIDILIVISADDSKDKRVKEFLDNVKIDARQYGNTVELTTERVTKNISFKSIDNFSIDYTIKMPEKTNLAINNSFGDVKIDGIGGTLDLNIQHGDVFIGHADSDQNKLDIQFGDLRIDAVNALQLNIQHGDITVGKGNNLIMDVQFGDSKIDLLSGACSIKSMHGDVSIKKLSSKLRSLAIDVQFSDVSLDDFGDGHYAIDLSGDFMDYSWDDAWLVRSKNSEMNSYSFKLETPNGAGEAKKITIKASHSDVDLD